MTFLDKLETFMQRTIAFGINDSAMELVKMAEAEGLPNIAAVLREYSAAVSLHDIDKASAYFSMLHIFLQG